MARGWLYEQDKEDFEQEKKIREWQGKRKSRWDKIDYLRINYGRKGSPRHTGNVRSISLHAEVGEDGARTLEDFIAGSDGRDLYGGNELSFDEILNAHLECMGLGEDLSEWVTKRLKLSEARSQSRFQKFLTDLEW